MTRHMKMGRIHNQQSKLSRASDYESAARQWPALVTAFLKALPPPASGCLGGGRQTSTSCLGDGAEAAPACVS